MSTIPSTIASKILLSSTFVCIIKNKFLLIPQNNRSYSILILQLRMFLYQMIRKKGERPLLKSDLYSIKYRPYGKNTIGQFILNIFFFQDELCLHEKFLHNHLSFKYVPSGLALKSTQINKLNAHRRFIFVTYSLLLTNQKIV